ncbi:DUF4262 domain-containing protein [Nonomuraea sp. MTCD27]|uniref:DUF4262 domain-containing protein n=1 Tax=Nonomuraea sp. MTCD27 TaxID=1676747 RepID=UPI0035C12A64
MPVDLTACHCVLCNPPDELDRRTRLTIGKVQEHGWQVTMIPRNEHGPGWAFTIGLWHHHRSPELAMFGLDIHDMQTCLNSLGDKVVAGEALKAGQEWQDIIDQRPVALKAVDHRWYHTFFGTALGFYRRPPFPFLQVVWPSPDNTFPWQGDGDDHQPHLWLRPDEHPAGVWTR